MRGDFTVENVSRLLKDLMLFGNNDQEWYWDAVDDDINFDLLAQRIVERFGPSIDATVDMVAEMNYSAGLESSDG